MKTTPLLLLLLFSLCVSAQGDSVKYSKEFTFREGVYLSFEQFRKQTPLHTDRIVSGYEKTDPGFLQKVLQKTTLTYRNEKDSAITVKTAAVWGYSRGGIVFVNHGREFNRLVVIGSLCHFTAYVNNTTYQHDPYNLGVNTQPGYAQEQFMIDILMGKTMPFTPIAIEFVLQRDDALLKEWQALSKSAKKKSAFLFLRKYNEKYPLYFPQ
ncbi:MAG: hypothetical protein IT233_11440 [Bacteroidia bacterium]|nr:hypothetical protein [Bacteroidia bacterium]